VPESALPTDFQENPVATPFALLSQVRHSGEGMKSEESRRRTGRRSAKTTHFASSPVAAGRRGEAASEKRPVSGW
jgi:hypothetical protein